MHCLTKEGLHEIMKSFMDVFAPIDEEKLLKRLKKPTGKVDVVLDTDTFNEVDDQYAIAYLLKSSDKMNLKALYAAPFCNMHASSPAEGMEKSYQEILNILNLMDRQDLYDIVYRGSEAFHPSETEPVVSEAAKDLAERAMNYTEEKPLYVIAIGAITNVSSALLLNPEIRDRIVLIWLGGCAHHWPHNRAFNVYQDVAGARIVFGCGVALVQVPGPGVVHCFTTSKPELEYWLRGKNKLCDYLIDKTIDEVQFVGGEAAWTRTIWDVVPVAWLLEDEFMQDYIEHGPIPEYDDRYSFDKNRHPIRYVYYVNRDKLFHDMFTKLAGK